MSRQILKFVVFIGKAISVVTLSYHIMLSQSAFVSEV